MCFRCLSALIKHLDPVIEKSRVNDQDKNVFLHFPMKKMIDSPLYWQGRLIGQYFEIKI